MGAARENPRAAGSRRRSEAVQKEIRAALDHVERQEEVSVLYAVESGSRAWGFASTDSDWDVRFIYVHRPAWYLSVQRRRDVLEYPLSRAGLDVSGWDLRRALGLLAKSNPPLLEWLRSPLVYREARSAASRMRELSSRHFSARSCLHHYLHMAEGNDREYLRGDTVRVKKYFYVLRPVLACRWIEAHGTMPPMEFAALVEDQLPRPLRGIVDDLLQRKRSGEELASGPRVPEINDFVGEELARLRASLSAMATPPGPDWTALDGLFREVLAEAWGEAGT
jgi:predicted nucleotidyltransferase